MTIKASKVSSVRSKLKISAGTASHDLFGWDGFSPPSVFFSSVLFFLFFDTMIVYTIIVDYI